MTDDFSVNLVDLGDDGAAPARLDGRGLLGEPHPDGRRIVARINDVGGMEGFGPLDPRDDSEPFRFDWEARTWALNKTLLAQGRYTLDEFRDAIERMPAQDYLAASYYERWHAAVRTLVVEKDLVGREEVDEALGRPEDA